MTRALTVWLLQTGEPLPTDGGDPRPMRAINLSNALVAAGHQVILWSSSFSHADKSHRVPRRHPMTCLRPSAQLEVRLLDSPGYRSNIGLGRLWDHAAMARSLAAALRSCERVPDVAFIGYPPIETAAVLSRWLAERSIPFLVDVKDQWPDVFVRALPSALRGIGRVGLAPYYHYARRSMRDATALSAMADAFLDWAVARAGRMRTPLDRVVPLTSGEAVSDEAQLGTAAAWWDRQGIQEDGRWRAMFVGSHSGAFDMAPVVEAARRLPDCQLVICGSGEATDAWRRSCAGLDNVLFPGWIDRAKIQVLARRSRAALAPYRNTDDFMMSLPNKVIDAMSLGLPILSPLRGEVEGLIRRHRVGVHYGEGGGPTLADCIARLRGQPDLEREMAGNARALYREHFSPEAVYGGLVLALEGLAAQAQR